MCVIIPCWQEEQHSDHNYRGKRRYSQIQSTKKLGCQAAVTVTEIVRFPEFKVLFVMYWVSCNTMSSISLVYG
jgi:hypothetical protein